MKNKKNILYHLMINAYFYSYHPEFIIEKKSKFIPEIVNYGLVFKRMSLKNIWPDDVTIYVTGEKPISYLSCSAPVNLVSDETKKIIEDYTSGDIEFLPVNMLYEDGRPYIATNYWVLNVLAFLTDVLDWENTIWTVPTVPNKNDPEFLSKIIRPCLLEKNITGVHMFRFEEDHEIYPAIYISSQLKNALKKANCTSGMYFGSIRTS